MAAGWRGKRRTVWTVVLAVLVVIGLAIGVGAAIVAAWNEGQSTAAGPEAGASPTPGDTADGSPETGGTDGGSDTGGDPDDGADGIAYVALGDSYAAGQGAGDYSDGRCLRSAAGYPALLDADPGIRLAGNLSCSGDTTDDLLAGQLGALGDDTRLVTVTIGGNDLGAIQVAAACSTDEASAECQSRLAAAEATLAPGGALQERLNETFARIRAAAPDARIVATGYPNLFEESAAGAAGDATLIASLTAATAALNANIRSAVDAQAGAGADIVFAEVVDAFAGHGVGSTDPWILSTGPDLFHPTAAGYAAYADVIRAALDCDAAPAASTGGRTGDAGVCL